jgi:hypothetical protein
MELTARGGAAGAASIEALRRRALEIGAARIRPLPAAPPDLSHEFGETPEGYGRAFRLGSRLPWPGPRADPDLASFWTGLGRSRPSGRFEARPEVVHRPNLRHTAVSNGGTGLAGVSRWEGSPNWSGAYLTARDAERFSALCASWRVPNLRRSNAAPPILGASIDEPPSRRASVWIGLDGHSRFAASLPQVGTTTAEFFRDGEEPSVASYAWVQWWTDDDDETGEQVLGLAVSPGDEVTCWLALHGPGRAVLCIRNETTGLDDGALLEPAPAAGAAADSARPAIGQSAVWVVERPGVLGRSDLFPLPDFDGVTFRNCIAGVRGAGSPFEEVADLRSLSGARYIRMYARRHRSAGESARAPRIASPDRPGPTRTQLTVRYRG